MRDNSTSPSRPWWILGHNLEHNLSASGRWDDSVCYCSIVQTTALSFGISRADWMYSGEMVVWWTFEKRIRWSHWSITRIGNDSSTPFYGKCCLPILSYPTIPLLFGNQTWNCSPEFWCNVISDSSITLKRSLDFTLRRRSPSSLLYYVQVRICATKYSAASPFFTHRDIYPHALQASYLISSHMRRYMECQKVYQLYTVSQPEICYQPLDWSALTFAAGV